MFKNHGCNVYLAAEIKKHVSVPVAAIGELNDPGQMEEIIASGKADIVYMARALLADPFLPRKVTENREDEIVRCLRCFTCMAERAVTSTRRCTVNPLIGREMDGVEVHPAPVRKKVLVAGGGLAGCECAIHLGMEGKNVHIVEMRDMLTPDANVRHRPFVLAWYEIFWQELSAGFLQTTTYCLLHVYYIKLIISSLASPHKSSGHSSLN